MVRRQVGFDAHWNIHQMLPTTWTWYCCQPWVGEDVWEGSLPLEVLQLHCGFILCFFLFLRSIAIFEHLLKNTFCENIRLFYCLPFGLLLPLCTLTVNHQLSIHTFATSEIERQRRLLCETSDKTGHTSSFPATACNAGASKLSDFAVDRQFDGLLYFKLPR